MNRLPIFPLYYNGNTKFIPIHVSDLTEIIYQVISKNITATTIECIGPEIISLKKILQRLLKIIDKKRLLIPLPLPLLLENYLLSFFNYSQNHLLTFRSIKAFT